MGLIKTKTDLVGTPSSMTSVTTGQLWKGTSSAAAFVRRDVSGKVGLAYTFKVTYSGVTPSSNVRPKLELFSSVDDTDGGQDSITYESVELPTPLTGSGISATYQVTIPVRFAEDIRFLAHQITAPTFSAGTVTVYLGITESAI